MLDTQFFEGNYCTCLDISQAVTNPVQILYRMFRFPGQELRIEPLLQPVGGR